MNGVHKGLSTGMAECSIPARYLRPLYCLFCILGCVVKFPAREAKSWWRRASSNLCNWMCLLFLFLISFLPYRFSIFSRSNAHTHTNKEGAKTSGKAKRRQRSVRFTRFLFSD